MLLKMTTVFTCNMAYLENDKLLDGLYVQWIGCEILLED